MHASLNAPSPRAPPPIEPQGDAELESKRCRDDPRKDWPLLQRLSCWDPELFWGALLRDELRLPFATPPKRCGDDELSSHSGGRPADL